MPSFATEVKNEMARKSYGRSCCRRAELAALLRMGAALAFGLHRAYGLTFTTENAAVARKVLQLLKKEGGGLTTEITVSRSRRLKKNNTYTVRVLPEPRVAELLASLGFIRREGGSPEAEESLNMESDSALLRKSCCRAAYLRGAFQGGGSVNRPEAAYHLELATGNYAFAQLLHSLLRRMGLPAGLTDRKDMYVIYLKEGDAIIDFLALCEAEQAVEAMEVARNVKEVREQVNRLVNCETANLQKTVDAAGRQLELIQRLSAEGRLDELSPKLRAAALARLARPEASLSELAEELGISKSGMNHRLRKLREFAEVGDIVET